MSRSSSAGGRSLADKLDVLFKTIHPKEGEYTHEQVAIAIRQAGGPTISATYLWQLRKGVRDNPTKRHLEALAQFFGVPPAFLFDDDSTAPVDEELELLASLRDAGVHHLALRARGPSEASLRAMAEMVEQARRIEGL